MPLTIVQATANSANGTDGTSVTAHWGAAPTNGNLLVAIVMSWENNGDPVADTGWTLATWATGVSTDMNISVFYRYAGGADSADQKVLNQGANYWAICAWEINGVSGVWATDFVAAHIEPDLQVYPSSGPTATTAFNTANNDELVLGGFTGNSAVATDIASSTGTNDASSSTGGGLSPCAARAVHYDEPVAGASITSSLSVTQQSSVESAFVELAGPGAGSVSLSVGSAAISSPVGTSPTLAQLQTLAVGNSAIGSPSATAPSVDLSEARVSQMVVMALGETVPDVRASQQVAMALVQVEPDARASQMFLTALAGVVPQVRASSMVVRVLADFAPCLTFRAQMWKITRRDGVVLTYTSHDRDVTWGGRVYKHCKSLDPSASENSSVMGSVGSIELTGIIDDEGISEEDLYGGLYDDAQIEVWLVSWGDETDTPKRLAAGNAGDLSQGEGNFKMEVLGPSQRLSQQAVVELVAPGCRWIFGDPRTCQVDIDALAISGQVLESKDRSDFIADLGGADGAGSQWANGRVEWTSGRNEGLVTEVKAVDFGTGHIVLWALTGFRPEYGDTFDLKPGCDKAYSGGCTLYNNKVRFGGFPDVPGQDALLDTPDAQY